MGAGIVKPQPDGGFQIHIHTGNNQNIRTTGTSSTFTSSRTSTSTSATQGRSSSPMGCEDCAANFTPFKRKKLCKDCGRNFCSQCVIQPNRRPSSANSKDYQCRTCQILLTGKFTRSQLHSWKIKDLKALLNKQNINISKCKEKNDLIDVIFTNYGSTPDLHRRGTEQELLVQQMAERMRQEQESSSPRQSTTANPEPPPTSSYNPPPSEATGDNNPQQQQSSDNEQQQQQSDQEMADLQEAEDTEVKDSQPVNPHIQLDHIQSEAEIDELDIKSLKRLLLNNFVDFKGCREKWELRDRVKRLWRDNEANKKKYQEQTNLPKTDSSSVPPAQNVEDDLCKICMDATIDCVLLECGHMISCTKCGKQLSECPMCRQYVVRAVHTFRS